MSIRYAIAALVLSGGACVAHADVLPTAGASQSAYLSDWDKASGTDIAGSGVLSSGSTLIGGVANGNDALAQALLAKASANVGQTGAQYTFSYAQGINGSYLVGMSNAKLAAALGNSISVVGSGQDITVSTGSTSNAIGEVPEPSTMALMLAGVLGAMGLGRRRRS
jgi:hypothetical protein